jgi:hypothetical protein
METSRALPSVIKDDFYFVTFTEIVVVGEIG